MGRNDIGITIEEFRGESEMDNSEIEADTMCILERIFCLCAMSANLAFMGKGLPDISNWLSSSICSPLLLEKKSASVEP